MAQVYKSIYMVDYKRPALKRTLPILPINDCFESPPEGAKWLNPETDFRLTREEAEAKAYKRLLKKYITTYSKEYCGVNVNSDDVVVLKGNQLLETSKKIYMKGDNDQPMLPPQGSGRNVLGYMCPRNFRTDLTTYQEYHGKVAFNWLFDADKRMKVSSGGGAEIVAQDKEEKVETKHEQKNKKRKNRDHKIRRSKKERINTTNECVENEEIERTYSGKCLRYCEC